MKKIFIICLTIISMLGIGMLGYKYVNSQDIPIDLIGDNKQERFVVNKETKVMQSFKDQDQAIDYAKKNKRTIIIDKEKDEWVYSSLKPFMIITEHAIHDFDTLEKAVIYAKRNNHKQVWYQNDKIIVWENPKELSSATILNVPLIYQYPELQRGCEVTSLAMLFKFQGLDKSKLELAKEIKKDQTPYSKDEKGRIYYGNPYDGFVGDMYDLKKNGYGVYHGPIYDLAKTYFKDRTIDATGIEFEDIVWFVSKGMPVWIVTNGTYKALPEQYFEMWHTPTGIVKITRRMHAVLMTGYDEKNIYINDPLRSNKNIKLKKEDFQAAWGQMGNQAIIILPDTTEIK